MSTAIRFCRVTISMCAVVLTSYVVSFFVMRSGVRASFYPVIYIFSSDPVKNEFAHKLFRPMIAITGGVSSLRPEAGNFEDPKTENNNRPVYLIGTEPLFGRIAAHHDAFLNP